MEAATNTGVHLMAGEYLINYSNNALKPAFTIMPRAINTDTSLTLYGKGASRYGEGLQEDLIHMLENFCNTTPPANPTIGQLWYQPESKILNICSATTPAVIWSAVNIINGGDAPQGAFIGTLWFDVANTTLKYWDGNGWAAVGDTAWSLMQSQLNTLGTGKVSKTGDTMSGFLFLHHDPVDALHAATKRYTDMTIFAALQASSGSNQSAQQKKYELYATSNGQTIFTLPQVPFLGNARLVFVDGVLQDPSSYTMSGAVLTLTAGVSNGSSILVDTYALGGTPGISELTVQTQTITGTPTVVTLAHAYVLGTNRLLVFVNGVKQRILNSYNETDTTHITFTAPLSAGDKVTTVIYTLTGTAAIVRDLIDSMTTQTIFPTTTYHHTSQPADPMNVGVSVFVSGISQGLNEYAETNGTSIVLSSAVSPGTDVEIYVFNIN